MNIELASTAAAAAATNVTHNNRDTCWKYKVVRVEYWSYYSTEMMETGL